MESELSDTICAPARREFEAGIGLLIEGGGLDNSAGVLKLLLRQKPGKLQQIEVTINGGAYGNRSQSQFSFRP